MALVNMFGDLSLEVTQLKRYGGGKTAYTATVASVGDTIIRQPAAGKKITLFWVYAVADSASSVNPIIRIKLGTTELYRVIGGVSHWEPFVGDIDQPLIVHLSDAGANVIVTFHILED